MNKKQELDKVELTQKEKFIEWTTNLLALLMLVAFFLKIVFL